MRIGYVTASAPFGSAETFLYAEIAELVEAGHEICLIPVNPRGLKVNDADTRFENYSHAPNVISMKVINGAVAELVRSPSRVLSLARLVARGPFRIRVKNLAVLPKALWVARMVRKLEIDHLHAYWASTPATVGLIASSIARVDFSFTAHAWDIAENNLLREKAQASKFVRVISQHGRDRVIARIHGSDVSKVHLMHLGVRVPPAVASVERRPNGLRCLTPANLVEKKGHRYLLDAIRLLRREHPLLDVEVVIAGSGPLAADLRNYADRSGIGFAVHFAGHIPHADLLERYDEGRDDVVVLSSVATGAHDEEGIPVALMEAMARGIPVVATDSGGTVELLSDGAGIVVPQRNGVALADALMRIVDNPTTFHSLALAGRKRILEEFDITRTVPVLITKFEA